MNDEEDILNEILTLIAEQTDSLQSRLSPEAAVRCQERSDRIRKLLEQISRKNASEQLRDQR